MLTKSFLTLATVPIALAMAPYNDIEGVPLDDRDLGYDFQLPSKSSMAIRPRSSQVYSNTDPGELEQESVDDNISDNVQALIQSFNVTGGLPDSVLQVLSQAMNSTLGQYITNTDTTQQLSDLSNTIQNQLEDIGNTFLNDIGSGTGYDSLRKCITDTINQNGLEPGQSCLMDNGADIEAIKQQFEQTVQQYNFSLPIKTMQNLVDEVNSYLNTSSLIDPARQLVNQTLSAMLSVAASTAGDYTNAILHAGNCYFAALELPVYDPNYVYDCETQSQNADGTVGVGTTLTDLENVYRSTINQYVGFLQPNVIKDIQDIGEQLLPRGDPGSPAASMQTEINNAILSVVSSTAGNSVSIGYQLLNCLNVMYTADPNDAVAKSKSQTCAISDGVVLSKQLIVDGYLQQFYGVLPPSLVLSLTDMTVPVSTTPSQLQQTMNDLFIKSGAGPAYVTCYEQFEDCTMAALKATEAGETVQTCTPNCSAPFNGVDGSQVGEDGSNPYGSASSTLSTLGQSSKRTVSKYLAEFDLERMLREKREEFEWLRKRESFSIKKVFNGHGNHHFGRSWSLRHANRY